MTAEIERLLHDPVLAALVGAAVGALSSKVAAWRDRRRRAHAEAASALEAAAVDLLQASLAFASRAQSGVRAKQFRSGLPESLGILSGDRKSLDPFEFHDWLATDFNTLTACWSRVWLMGDPDLITVANALVDACGGVLSVAELPSGRNRVVAFVAGEGWSEDQEAALTKAMGTVGYARRRLAAHVRASLGRDLPEQLLM